MAYVADMDTTKEYDDMFDTGMKICLILYIEVTVLVIQLNFYSSLSVTDWWYQESKLWVKVSVLYLVTGLTNYFLRYLIL